MFAHLLSANKLFAVRTSVNIEQSEICAVLLGLLSQGISAIGSFEKKKSAESVLLSMSNTENSVFCLITFLSMMISNYK